MNDSKPASHTWLITGFLAAGAALLGLGMCTSALQKDRNDVTPELTLVAPAAGDTVADSLVIRFRTSAPLALGEHGWAADDLHPHVLLDGVEHMAASRDIRADGNDFLWRLPTPAPGEHAILLTWAGMHHGTVGDTVGRTIRFVVR